MKAKGLIAVLIAFATLTGCSGSSPEQESSTEHEGPKEDVAVLVIDPQIEEAKEMIVALLVDPESAQFRNMRKFQGAVCGEYNAKNSMGGYTGFEKFLVRFEPVKDSAPKLKTECTEEALKLAANIDKLASGELTPEQLVESVLAEIDASETEGQ